MHGPVPLIRRESVYTSQLSAPLDGGDRKWRVARTSPTELIDAGFEFREVAKRNPLATGTLGGAFDGRYIYFALFPRGSPLPGTVYLRYDTQQPFDADGAWASVTGQALGFVVYSHRGAVFDGMNVYFPPGERTCPSCVTARPTPARALACALLLTLHERISPAPERRSEREADGEV